MARMIALKRLRYPRGADGREYREGDRFETLSDRDTKALTIIRAAREATAADRPKPPKAQEPATEDAPLRKRRYLRRDVVAGE